MFQTTYSDHSGRHFHEKLRDEHSIALSYGWVKQALQGAGLRVYIAEFNRLFAEPAREKGTAFSKCTRKDLDEVFSIQMERTVS